jgi:hypothetical protein
MRTKKSAFEKYLMANHILEDYFDSIKSYEKYQKEIKKNKPNQKNIDKIKEELNRSIPNAIATLSRFYRTYTAIKESMQKEVERQAYPDDFNKNNQIEILKTYIENVENIKKELEKKKESIPPIPSENVPEPKIENTSV